MFNAHGLLTGLEAKSGWRVSAIAGVIAAGLSMSSAGAAPLTTFPFLTLPMTVAPAPVAPQTTAPQADDESATTELPARFKRQIVSYQSREPAGTIIIDTGNTYLYYVLGSGRAIRYGIGVGRQGFTWSGTQSITRKAEWPDWTPPSEMVVRQPYLPRFVAGGPGNPLGARAMYLGGTIYRIHGTNNPSTIGGRVSSGCIRMTNEDVTDLYSRAAIGTKVIVLPIERHAENGTDKQG
jgi:lipoprotein-anchoring transpeptidase ErfK/SrfK